MQKDSKRNLYVYYMNIQLAPSLPPPPQQPPPPPSQVNKMKSSQFDDYIMSLPVNVDKLIVCNKNPIKVNDDELKIPNMMNYREMGNYNYSVNQLKTFAKHYKLRVTGNKKDLLFRVFLFLHLSTYSIRIQRHARGNMQRVYNELHGPAYKKRSICTNDSDFVTLDDLKEIPFHQFISYRDVDGFIYGFDIASLYNLLSKNMFNHNTVQNPYNRTTMSSEVFAKMFYLISLSKVMQIRMNIHMESDIANVSVVKAVELRALELFQTIDSLGNYSDPAWFLSLNRHQLVKLVRELCEIFSYRAQLTQEIKQNICPPAGNPFVGISQHYLQTEYEIVNVQRNVLGLLEKFVNSGINTDSKSLGAYYVLAALTLVSDPAAASLPWLYHSVAYI